MTDDYDTIPASDPPHAEPADLLASVALRLESVCRDLALALGEMRVHGRRLTDLESRVAELEQKVGQ